MKTKTMLLSLSVTLLLQGSTALDARAQTTYRACRVPDVGAIYMISVSGAPDTCLDAGHVEFSWTEGGAPAAGSVAEAALADGAVTEAKIADDAVTAAKIADGSVGASEIADGSVGSAELADGAVTAAKISGDVALGVPDGSIGTAQLADGAVTTAKIATGAIGSPQIADGSVNSTEIALGSVGTAQLQDGGVTTDDIADGAVTVAKLGGDVNLSVGDGSIGTAQLADGAVTTAKIASDAVTSGNIADGTVTSADIANGTIASTDIADGAVTSADVANGSLSGTDIADGSIGAADIGAGAVGASELATGAVTPAKILANQTWDFGGNSGSVRLHGGFSGFNNTVLLSSWESTGFNGPQARFDGASTGFWDFGLNASGNFVVEYNDGAVCSLTSGSSWACASDRALKEGFATVEPEVILRRLADLDIQSWSYLGAPSVRHVGPVSQDFFEAFGLGDDRTKIGLLDASGISMVAIQALEARTTALATENERLRAEIDALRSALGEEVIRR